MLTIQNIDKIVGKTLKTGRFICEAGDYNSSPFGTEGYYKFNVAGPDPVGQQMIVLQRTTGNMYNPNDYKAKGKYELFCMGLQSITHRYLTKQEIENPNTLIGHIEMVMESTEEFYKNKNY